MAVSGDLPAVLLIRDRCQQSDFVVHVCGAAEPDLVGRLPGSFGRDKKFGFGGLDKT